jgi:TonB family protein
MARKTSLFRIALFILGLALIWIMTPVLSSAFIVDPLQQIDPFYTTLLEKAQKSFLAKNYESASGDFEVAAFGLAGNKTLRARALVYLSLCRYYLKDLTASEKYLRDAADLMGNAGFAELQIHESARPELEKLLAFYSIQIETGENPAAALAKSAAQNSNSAAKPEDKSPPEKKPKDGSNASIPQKPLSEIKEGDLIALDIVDTVPSVIKRVDPVYPASAKRLKLGGTVIVNVLVSEKGDVLKAEIARGLRTAFGFNQESLRAVRQWKFNPASIKGIRVKVWMPVAIEFKAEGAK